MYKAKDFAYSMYEWIVNNPNVERAEDIEMLCELLIADEYEIEKYENAIIENAFKIRQLTEDITKILEK